MNIVEPDTDNSFTITKKTCTNSIIDLCLFDIRSVKPNIPLIPSFIGTLDKKKSSFDRPQ